MMVINLTMSAFVHKTTLHQVIPLIHRQLFLRVYNNENGACHTSASNIGSSSAMHIKSR